MTELVAQVQEAGTLLVIYERGGLPIYSARGLEFSPKPIDQNIAPRRTVNAKLVDMANPKMKKYAISISGNDLWAPPIDEFWRGQELTIESPLEFAFYSETGATGATSTGSRTGVTGSYRTVGKHTFYRPILNVRVMDWEARFNEWDGSTTWTLDVEEI